MRALDTSMGGSFREFPSTPAFAGLDDLSRVYWKPVYLYIRTVWKCSNEDAKDLSQQFFLHLLKNQTVDRYRPDRGPFRVYLKSCLKNFLTDESRRRPGVRAIPLDEAGDAAAAPEADGEFERAWLQTVLESALQEVREELATEGRTVDWSVFEAYDLRPPDTPKATYSELGRAHGLSESEVRAALATVRGKLRDRAIEQVRRSVSDADQLYSELGHLRLL